MSLHIDGRIPPPASILSAYERAARQTAAAARDETVAAVRRVFPAHSRETLNSIRGSVRQTPQGLAIYVAPGRDRRYIARFVEGGTGVRGPFRRRIPADKRGRLPDGRRPSGRGQAAQRPFGRVRDSEATRVLRTLEDGATLARRSLGL